ncbi:MAG: ATP-binding protein [Planctomycetaceae bacterium]|nr:ATP-binding protein [Planctomycetaceae bacterium]
MSPSNDHRFEFELDNDKSKVTPTVELLLDACEAAGLCDLAGRFRISVALEEALVNAIVHGNLEVSSDLRESGDDLFEQTIAQRQEDPRFHRRRVRLHCRISGAEGCFTIRDQGPGFDVSQIPDPTDDETLDRPSGRGMLLMRSFMDEVVYNSKGNEVTLIKRNASVAVGSDPEFPTMQCHSE